MVGPWEPEGGDHLGPGLPTPTIPLEEPHPPACPQPQGTGNQLEGWGRG